MSLYLILCLAATPGDPNPLEVSQTTPAASFPLPNHVCSSHSCASTQRLSVWKHTYISQKNILKNTYNSLCFLSLSMLFFSSFFPAVIFSLLSPDLCMWSFLIFLSLLHLFNDFITFLFPLMLCQIFSYDNHLSFLWQKHLTPSWSSL